MKIRRVDGSKWAQELIRAQEICLPHDDVLDPAESGEWWLALAPNGDVAAFASMHLSRRWLKTGFLSRAGVLPAYRGRGLQKRLIRAREAHARRRGREWLITDTTENPESANSLIACGFKIYEPSWPYRVKNTIYWRKKLCD